MISRAATGYWRVRWEEGRRRDISACSREEAVAKAAELVERLGRGSATDLGRPTGAELVAHYLDPGHRPARVESWSQRHRDEQVRYCELCVLPVMCDIPSSTCQAACSPAARRRPKGALPAPVDGPQQRRCSGSTVIVHRSSEVRRVCNGPFFPGATMEG
jgi:hypothetical protein